MDPAAAIVGRRSELQVIRDAVAARRCVVLTGDAGVGKSTLAVHALVDGPDAAPCVLRASPGTRAIALGVLAHRLERDADRTDPTATLGATIELLAACGTVLVDDGEQLDPVTSAAVRLTHGERHVAVVVTTRAEDRLPDGLAQLRRDPTTTVLRLAGLDHDDAAALVESQLGGRADAHSHRLLHRRTGGNPLHLRELVEDGLRTGALAAHDGVWAWRGPVRPGATLRGLVGERLVGLTADTREALDVIAFAEPIPLDAALDLIGADALVALERARVVTVEGDSPTVRTSHPLYGDMVRDDLGRVRQRVLAERLLRLPPAGDDPHERVRRGDLLLRAGAGDPATLADAATAALGLLDFDRAHALASEALRLDGSATSHAPDAAGERRERMVRAAAVLAAIGRYDDAVGLLDDTAPADDVAWVSQQATSLFLRDRHGRRASDVLDHAVADDRHQELAATRAWVELFDGEVRRARRTASGVFEDPTSSPTALVWAAIAGASAGALGDDTATGAALLLTARTSLDRVRGAKPLAPLQVELADWLLKLCSLRVRAAAATADARYDDAVANGAPFLVGVWGGFAGWAALELGAVEVAERRLAESITLMASADPFGLTSFAEVVRAAALALAGDTVGADRQLARLDARAVLPGLLASLAERYRAWVVAARGDVVGAEDHLRRAVVGARDHGQSVVEAWCHLDLARLCGRRIADLDARRLAAAARDHHGVAVAMRATSAFGARDDAAVAMQRELAELGAMVLAGDLAVAVDLSTPALDGAGTTPWRTPLTMRVRHGGQQLTPRELEIVVLASAGLSSREIARRFDLSVRTVDNHLGRVYAKLGVSGRAELAARWRSVGA